LRAILIVTNLGTYLSYEDVAANTNYITISGQLVTVVTAETDAVVIRCSDCHVWTHK